jgi:Mn2+/Fe2+ NRAMP family transporter
VLLLAVAALVVYHELGAPLGLATGQGLVGLVRASYGTPATVVVTATLVVANLGTTCAEFAGVAAGLELAGISRYLSVPCRRRSRWAGGPARELPSRRAPAAPALDGLRDVRRRRLPRHPDWADAAQGMVVPKLPLNREAVVVVTAMVGTTLAPWGVAFIQSYAADKRLAQADLRYERVDVFSGAILTGVMRSLARRRELKGALANGRTGDALALAALAIAAISIVALATAALA